MAIESNIDDVIDDVGDASDELRYGMDEMMTKNLRLLANRVKLYIRNDPDYEGELLRSISKGSRQVDKDGRWRYWVKSDGSIAPYNAIVEFGSGKRTNQPYSYSGVLEDPDMAPPDYPFSAPNIPPKSGKFQAFVGYIADWMAKKGVIPQKDSLLESAQAISYTIINKGNYAHPYLRPAADELAGPIKDGANTVVRRAID